MLSGKRSKLLLPIPSILLITLMLLYPPAVANGGEVWPVPPESPPDQEGILEMLGGHRGDLVRYLYAAGLYRTLEESLSGDDLRLVHPDLLSLLARGLMSSGRGEKAASLLADREDLDKDIRLLLLMQDEDHSWTDLSRATWRESLSGRDSESLYWASRLESTLGETGNSRELLKELLRREPGSVFASASLEIMESLPLKEALPETPAVSTFVPQGVRVQWGVFRDPLRARRQWEAVEAYGHDAEIIPFQRDGVELFRVCSTPFSDEADARREGETTRERYGLEFILYRSAGTQ
jgi:hypothetical protein